MTKQILITVSLLLALSSVNAEDVYSEQFQTIQSVELVEVIEDANGEQIEITVMSHPISNLSEIFSNKAVPATTASVSGVIMATQKLIALGKEVYKIVEAGKPNVEMVSEPIHILPKADKDGNAVTAIDLEGWKQPYARKYRVNTKNYLGMQPASFEFIMIFSYGGSLEGNGQYITGAQIKPTGVNVKWGYSLDASFKVQSIMNAGSKQNPVAAAVLEIDYKISTILQEYSASKLFYINGTGAVQAY